MTTTPSSHTEEGTHPVADQIPDPTRSPVVPVADAINTIALTKCQDTEHRIHFRRAERVESLTLAELDGRARRVAGRLYELGVRARDRVGIMAPNRIEWVLLDLAVLKLGAVTAGIEPGRYRPERILDEFGLTLLFVEGGALGQVRDIAEVITWAEETGLEGSGTEGFEGGGFDGPALGEGYDPADICAIKQTSGSTGVPKGIEATTASVNQSIAAVQEMFDHRDGDNLMVFLPVRFLQQRYWIYSALVHGHDVTLADRITVLEVAKATAPTVVMGVPGFYEQLKARVEAAGPVADPAARCAAVQTELGGRIRYLWTGSAPAGRAMLDFFNDCGVPLYEGYGLNETCIVSKNHPGAARVGSVGKVLPHKRIRFDKDGILIVGTTHPVNTRYTWCGPGANEKTYLPTGEVRTFDIGHVDEDGFLYIDGRVDDIVTLSGALNILVPLVEERLRELPGIHDCAVFGDGKPYLTAVVSPAAPGTDQQALARSVSELNDRLRYEQRIYGVVVASEQFSIENGLLNAQYKLVRSQIAKRYGDDLDLIHQKHRVYNDGTVTGVDVLVTAAAEGTEEA
ncbi:long-chain acyl-CoA synthetase [Kitasatospora sp. GP30]|nr:long-chain acyl-CoA synthetase [Kitasatospora sp. GP30]